MIMTASDPVIGNVPIRRLVTGLWQMADQERDGKVFDLDSAA